MNSRLDLSEASEMLPIDVEAETKKFRRLLIAYGIVIPCLSAAETVMVYSLFGSEGFKAIALKAVYYLVLLLSFVLLQRFRGGGLDMLNNILTKAVFFYTLLANAWASYLYVQSAGDNIAWQMLVLMNVLFFLVGLVVIFFAIALRDTVKRVLSSDADRSSDSEARFEPSVGQHSRAIPNIYVTESFV